MKNYWLGSLFQRNAHSLGRRLYFAALPRFRAVFAKRQSVHFVRINGRIYKRVVMGDSHEADAVERALAASPPEAGFPPLVQRHENELLLGFIEGRRFEPARVNDRRLLVAFLAALYAGSRTRESSAALRRRFDIDADFLLQAGLIHERLHRALVELADAVQPEWLAVGLDYTDPVAKNFVVDGDRLYAIDVEALRLEMPLATAIAKAAVHWLPDAEVSSMVDDVATGSGVELAPQFPFVELCFRVGWTKRKLLQGRHRSIRTRLLEDLAARSR